MSSAIRYAPRYTVADYLQWQGDWELWDGIAVAMTPSPFGRHQAIVSRLIRLLGNAIEQQGCRATVLSDLDWIVRHDTVVRPDLIVICGPIPERHLESAPSLIAEVLSPATRRNDRTYKRELYAEQGVDTYLIVDPDSQSVEHLERSPSDGYRASERPVQGRLTVCEECEIEINFSDAFPRSQA